MFRPTLLLLLHDVTRGVQAWAPMLERLPCAYACSTRFLRGESSHGEEVKDRLFFLQ